MGDHFYTLCVHAGVEPDPSTGAIMTPIYQTSTFVQSEPGVHQGYEYSRSENPTRSALEKAFAALEGANFGLAFSSGLAAEQAIAQILSPGDRVLVCDDVYGGTGRLFRQLFSKYDIKFEFIDMTSSKELDEAFSEKVDLCWIETPTNPTLKIIDIEKVASRTKAVGGICVVDNTFASPAFQRPLDLGADIVVHSTTKYLGGHSDIVGGALMLRDKDLYEQLKFVQFAAGAVMGPMDSFLTLRSLKTLALRMERHHKNACLVAEALSRNKRVSKVFFPGLESHPGHVIAKKQMTGFSGMVSFELDGSYAQVVKFLSALKIFKLAESLGGVESLVNHPEKMTHASVPETLRKKLGIGYNLLRLSVGIEDSHELVADVEQALEAAF